MNRSYRIKIKRDNGLDDAQIALPQSIMIRLKESLGNQLEITSKRTSSDVKNEEPLEQYMNDEKHIVAKTLKKKGEQSKGEQENDKQVKVGQKKSEHEREDQITDENISEDDTQELVIEQLQPITLTFKVGQFRKKVQIISNETKHELTMSEALMHDLCLHDDLVCQINANGKELRFGPVFGVFVGKSYVYKLYKKQKAKKRTMRLIHANREAGNILYFFSMGDVDFSTYTVKGTYYDFNRKQWSQKLFPFPDVLYDRGSGKPNTRLRKQAFRMKLEKETPIKKFNAQHYFDKLDLHNKLSAYREMRPYLPLTLPYTKPQDLKPFAPIKKVYLKKYVSSNGNKIMRIEKQSPKQYTYSYYSKSLNSGELQNFTKVTQLIDKVYGKGQILAQSAIDLLSINGRNVDMRATVQRNRQGRLEVTATVVRVGGKGSPVTSTRTGSDCYEIEPFFKKYYNYSDEQIAELKQKIDIFLRKVYYYTEKSYGTFGEIGIDFALDKNGKIWFIECNAKPAKSSLCRACDEKTISKAFRYPLEYAQYLTGF